VIVGPSITGIRFVFWGAGGSRRESNLVTVTCQRSNPNLLIAGPIVSAGEPHGKILRAGYFKRTSTSV
jgi:hypothetical protein